MGDVLPFGTGTGDYSMNKPKLLGVGEVESDASVTAENDPPTTGATKPPNPLDPWALNKALDVLLKTLRITAQRVVTLLPYGAVPQAAKQDLLVQYTTLEDTAIELKKRLVTDAGAPENEAVAQDLEQVKLDVENLRTTVEKHIKEAKVVTIEPRSPLVSKKTAWYIGLGITTLMVGAALIWAYPKLKE